MVDKLKKMTKDSDGGFLALNTKKGTLEINECNYNNKDPN